MSEIEQLKAENRQLLADVISEQQKCLDDINKYRELRQAFLDVFLTPERCRELEALYIKLYQER
jgi:hypothetical protein